MKFGIKVIVLDCRLSKYHLICSFVAGITKLRQRTWKSIAKRRPYAKNKVQYIHIYIKSAKFNRKPHCQS